MIMLVSSLEYESGTTASWIGRNRFKNQGVWNMYFGAVYWATGCLKGQETRVNAGVTGGEGDWNLSLAGGGDAAGGRR